MRLALRLTILLEALLFCVSARAVSLDSAKRHGYPGMGPREPLRDIAPARGASERRDAKP